MRRVVAVVLLWAAAANAQPVLPPKLKLAVMDLSVIELSPERVPFYTELLAARLAQAGAEVTTSKAISTVLGMERQRQLLGCRESTACVTELAGALGVDGMVMGDVARIGETFTLSLRAVSAISGKAVGAFSSTNSTEDALVSALDAAAEELCASAATDLGRRLDPAAPSGQSSRRAWGYLSTAAGAAGLAAGGGLLYLAQDRYRQIPRRPEDPPRPASEVESLARTGSRFQSLGWGVLGVGTAALATGAVLLLWDSGPRATLAVVPGSSARLVVQGTFP